MGDKYTYIYLPIAHPLEKITDFISRIIQNQQYYFRFEDKRVEFRHTCWDRHISFYWIKMMFIHFGFHFCSRVFWTENFWTNELLNYCIWKRYQMSSTNLFFYFEYWRVRILWTTSSNVVVHCTSILHV